MGKLLNKCGGAFIKKVMKDAKKWCKERKEELEQLMEDQVANLGELVIVNINSHS